MRFATPPMILATVPFLSLLGCVDLSPTRVVDEVQQTLDAGGIESLRVTQGMGDMEIRGDDAATAITMTVTLLGPEGSDRDLDASRDLIVDLQSDNGVAKALAILDDVEIGYSMRVLMTVPSRLLVEVRDGSGDLTISRVNGLFLDDESGDIWIDELSGGLTVVDGSGDLDINGVIGAIDILDGSGDMDVYGVDGDVTIEDGSGDIRASQITGEVRVTDGSGDIVLREVGDVSIVEDGSGDVRIQ
ncbi:MAG: DUF4097 family beta strand repeat-containing protein [Myxococcota bacterium]